MLERSRYLVTQSLLSSWLWQYKAFDPESAHKDFMKTLRREAVRPNESMLNGIHFENMVTAYCGGDYPESDHKWNDGIRAVGDVVFGGQFQVPAYRDMMIGGIPFLLYGRMDVLRAGTIYDIKFSKSYEPGKYLDSPQHPMYFACCPEAHRFAYLVSNGTDLFVESYCPKETPPIEDTIGQFMEYLDSTGTVDLYTEKWKARK